MARELGLIFPGDPDPTARWFADHVPYATFMGVEIAASQNSTTGGVHQTMLDLLAAAETQLVAQGMPRAGEAAPENPADPELAGFTIRDISGLRQPRPATDQADGVSLHCYGMAVDVNVSRNPFVRRSGAAMVTRAVALMRGTEYILDSATGHDTASNAWDNLHAGSENLKAYFRLDRAGVERQLRTHQRARDMGDVAWWLEQIRADREDEDRNRNWVGGSPTARLHGPAEGLRHDPRGHRPALGRNAGGREGHHALRCPSRLPRSPAGRALADARDGGGGLAAAAAVGVGDPGRDRVARRASARRSARGR